MNLKSKHYTRGIGRRSFLRRLGVRQLDIVDGEVTAVVRAGRAVSNGKRKQIARAVQATFCNAFERVVCVAVEAKLG